jgi:DNA-binding XRE family transcriptional regulator
VTSQDIKDIKDFDKAISEAQEFFPQNIAEHLFAGDNPVMIFRKYRGLTQEQLSQNTIISRSYIAQIEIGKKTGSISTLKKIAQSLNVNIDLLV